MILVQPATAAGIFDILDETIYTGNWSETEHTINTPPNDGTWQNGRIWIISGVSKIDHKREGAFKYRLFSRNYAGGIYTGRGEFGTAVCKGEGCWVESIGGNEFFVREDLYARQSNHTKHLIDTLCGGVVAGDWEPFMGDPNNPYDVDVHNREVAWGYVGINFENLTKLNGVFRIPSEDSMSIAAGSWDEIMSEDYDKEDWQQHLWNVTDEIQYTTDNETATAAIDITVEWAHKQRDTKGDQSYCNHTAKATFSDTKAMPHVLNSTYANVVIVSHNNSVTPYSLIDVHIDENVTSTEIVYRNKSSTYHHKIGILTSDAEGLYFDFVDEQVWLPDSSNIVSWRCGYYVINEAPLNLSELLITVSTPYDSFVVTDYNVTVIHSTPSDYVHWEVMLAFLSLLGLFIAVPYILFRRLI